MKKLLFLLLIAGSFTMQSCQYNTMVEKQESVTAQWAQVENVYQRRADLIPNLVSTVKGYAAHEKEALVGVIEARSKAPGENIDASNLDASSIQTLNDAVRTDPKIYKCYLVLEKHIEILHPQFLLFFFSIRKLLNSLFRDFDIEEIVFYSILFSFPAPADSLHNFLM